MKTEQATDRTVYRHTLATLAYRAAKVFRDAPPAFASYKVDAQSRTPVEIVAHMGDLFDWALSIVKGQGRWNDSVPMKWEDEVGRFYLSLSAFDRYLSGDDDVRCALEKIFQGPIADALTHTGQLAMLRRLSGFPMKGENYFKSDIVVGNVGPNQAKPVKEF